MEYCRIFDLVLHVPASPGYVPGFCIFLREGKLADQTRPNLNFIHLNVYC